MRIFRYTFLLLSLSISQQLLCAEHNMSQATLDRIEAFLARDEMPSPQFGGNEREEIEYDINVNADQGHATIDENDLMSLFEELLIEDDLEATEDEEIRDEKRKLRTAVAKVYDLLKSHLSEASQIYGAYQLGSNALSSFSAQINQLQSQLKLLQDHFGKIAQILGTSIDQQAECIKFIKYWVESIKKYFYWGTPRAEIEFFDSKLAEIEVAAAQGQECQEAIEELLTHLSETSEALNKTLNDFTTFYKNGVTFAMYMSTTYLFLQEYQNKESYRKHIESFHSKLEEADDELEELEQHNNSLLAATKKQILLLNDYANNLSKDRLKYVHVKLERNCENMSQKLLVVNIQVKNVVKTIELCKNHKEDAEKALNYARKDAIFGISCAVFSITASGAVQDLCRGDSWSSLKSSISSIWNLPSSLKAIGTTARGVKDTLYHGRLFFNGAFICYGVYCIVDTELERADLEKLEQLIQKRSNRVERTRKLALEVKVRFLDPVNKIFPDSSWKGIEYSALNDPVNTNR